MTGEQFGYDRWVLRPLCGPLHHVQSLEWGDEQQPSLPVLGLQCPADIHRF